MSLRIDQFDWNTLQLYPASPREKLGSRCQASVTDKTAPDAGNSAPPRGLYLTKWSPIVGLALRPASDFRCQRWNHCVPSTPPHDASMGSDLCHREQVIFGVYPRTFLDFSICPILLTFERRCAATSRGATLLCARGVLKRPACVPVGRPVLLITVSQAESTAGEDNL